MNKNLALLVGLLVLALGLGWMVLGEDTAEIGIGSLERATPQEAIAPEQSHKLEPKAPLTSPPELESATLGESRSVAQPLATESNAVLLHVIDENDNPVADADVRVIWNVSEEQQRSFRDPAKLDELMDLAGEPLNADGAGVVALNKVRGEQRCLVEATQGELWGSMSFSGLSKKRILKLGRDVRLQVRVVDPTGKPVGGVPVIVKPSSSRWAATVRSALSDPSTGLVTFAHLQESSEPGKQPHVALDVLTLKKVMEVFDMQNPPSAPIELVMPAVGSVSIQVLEPDWEPYTGAGQVELRAFEKGTSLDHSPFSNDRLMSTRQTLEAGRANFPHVELGMNVQAQVTRDNSSVPNSGHTEGPRVSGESVALEVRLGSEHPILRMRALDVSGEPLANATLQVQASLRTEFATSTLGCAPITDADGYFLVDVPRKHNASANRLLLVKLLGDQDLEASFDFSPKLEDGINDLGDLHMLPPSVFVAGRAVGTDGAALGKVRLQLRSKIDGESSWRRNYQFSFRTDEDGSFVVTETQAGVEFELAVDAAGYASIWTPFQPGDEGVFLEAPKEGKITGTILVDEGVPIEMLRVAIGTSAGPGERRSTSWSIVHPDKQGHFAFGQLLAGAERSVKVTTDGQSDPLHLVKGLLVETGKSTVDPRLNPIDLRGRFHFHEIELVAPGDVHQLSGRIHYREAGAQEYQESTWLREANVRMLSEFEAIDIMVEAVGCRIEQVDNVRGHQEVVMREGIKVKLVLPADLKIPKAPIYLKASLAAVDRDAVGGWHGNAFDEQRELFVLVSSPGKEKVTWHVEQRSVNTSTTRTADPGREQLVNVLDSDGEQRIELILSQTELDKMLAESN